MKLDINVKEAIKKPSLKDVPFAIASQLLAVNDMLGVINKWSMDSYGELFWEGSTDFNPEYRVIYDGSVHITWKPPFVVPCIWVQRFPFGIHERSAKFGLARWMKEPLLDPGASEEWKKSKSS